MQSDLSGEVQGSVYVWVSALTMNFSHLVRPESSSHTGVVRKHRLSSFWQVQSPAQHSGEAICMVPTRLHKRHIHSQVILSDDLDQGVSRLRISISLDAFVVSCAFPLKASVIHRCMHAESVTMCRTLACHWSTRLTPFRVASSSARFICLESFSGRSQQASAMMNSSTPRASELASTQTMNLFPSMHQFLRTGSS